MIFTGSTRMGMDMNLSHATIVVQGIIADDDAASIVLGNKAYAEIDFSRVHLEGQEINWYDASLHTNVDGKKFKLTDSNGAVWTVVFSADGSGSTRCSGKTITVEVGSSSSTMAAITTQVMNGINLGTGDNPGSMFTATRKTSTKSNTANAVVRIEHDVVGAHGVSSPSFDNWKRMGTIGPGWVPVHARFKGGKLAATKSAGDKAMDLWGSLNNMNNGGMMAIVSTGWHRSNEQADDKYGDYIIGIQIPYDSMITAEAGGMTVGDKIPRNFFMPTGPFHTRDTKSSDQNTVDVNVEFKPWESAVQYQGIKGTVQDFSIDYDAGETVYFFRLTFLPIDWIL
jgi:hypothetical protein